MVTNETYGIIKNISQTQPTKEETSKILYKLGIIDENGNVMPQYVGMLKNFKNKDNTEK